MIGKWHRIFFVVCWGSVAGLSAQVVPEQTPVLLWPPGSPGNTKNIIRATAGQELEYSFSLSASHFLNSNNRNDLVVSLHSLTYRVSLTFPKQISLSGKLHHDLGFRFFSDSTTVISPDETTISTQLLILLRKDFKIAFSSDFSSRLFNKAEEVYDKNGGVHIRSTASFMNPLIADLSVGFSYSQPGLGEIRVGTSSARLTLITDAGIFKRIGRDHFHGIPEGKNHLFEYGLSLYLRIDKELLKHLNWKCDLKIFKNYLLPVDLSLNNIFSFNLNRFVIVTFRTFIIYESATSKKVQMENHLNIGFSLLL